MTDMVAKHMINVNVIFEEGKEFPLLNKLGVCIGESGKIFERAETFEEDGVKEFQIFTNENPIEIKKIIIPILLSSGVNFKLGVY